MRQEPLKAAEIQYPESDGKPIDGGDMHRELMARQIDTLRGHLRDEPDAYVSGNLFVYYEEGNPESVVAPDVFVVRGVPKTLRKTYKVWEEEKGPEFVLELTSTSTHREDLHNKRAIYEELLVREYFLFDPEGVRFQPPLRGFRLKEGLLQPIPVARKPDGAWAASSEFLGLELHGSGSSLRWVDPRTGKPLPSRAEAERARAEAERTRAERAEAELARLREEIARRAP